MKHKNDENYVAYKNSRFYGYFNSLAEEVRHLRDMGVSFLFFQTPLASKIKSLSPFEKERIDTWEFDFNNITQKDCEMIKNIYPENVSIEYLQNVYDGAKVYEREGIKYLSDFESEYVNVINGKRVTYYQPSKYVNNIYIYGQCTARGTGVEDKNTIASFLQQMINEKYPNSYQIENAAIGCGSDIHDDLAHMKKSNFKAGDIIVLCTNLEIVPEFVFEEKRISRYDCSQLFERPHSYGEWFTDMTFHTNEKGNKVIATYIYNILEQQNLLSLKEYLYDISYISETDENYSIDGGELERYFQSICTDCFKKGLFGAIVMNCNPFTLGHLYLIETAASQVDYLYIFVVEENKSYFSFEDRLQLVREGTRHIKNVYVVPSGKFIISAVTFPGYFYKDGNTEIAVDPSKDVHIFGKYIAPKLGITKRFVGNEPGDYVTRTYNETMKKILPAYNVQVIEIPRKEVGGQVISASLVRKYLEKREFEPIKELVPKSTYEYLVKNYD